MVAGLASLSPDLIHIICEVLCSHCCGLPLDAAQSDDEAKRFAGLSGLCGASRYLREIAQPHLFHRPSIVNFTSLVGFIDEVSRDLRLAANVKDYRSLSCAGLCKDYEPFAYHVQSLARNCRPYFPVDFQWTQFNANNPRSTVELFDEFTISVLPRLEALTMVMRFHRCEEDYLPSPATRKPPQHRRHPGLANLKTLRIAAEDPAYGFTLSSPAIESLLASSPALADLSLIGACKFYHQPIDQRHVFCLNAAAPALQNLRSLEFRQSALEGGKGSVDYTYIYRMLQVCINLESFIYEFGPFYKIFLTYLVSAKTLVDALSPQKKTLKHLEIDQEQLGLNHFGPRREADKCQIPPPALKQFVRLETLILDERSFCRHWFGVNHGGYPKEDVSCLTQLLPDTVEKLVIYMAPDGYVMRDIVRLGLERGEGKFPKLNDVKVIIRYSHSPGPAWDGWQQLERGNASIMAAFEKSRISISVEMVPVILA